MYNHPFNECDRRSVEVNILPVLQLSVEYLIGTFNLLHFMDLTTCTRTNKKSQLNNIYTVKPYTESTE